MAKEAQASGPYSASVSWSSKSMLAPWTSRSMTRMSLELVPLPPQFTGTRSQRWVWARGVENRDENDRKKGPPLSLSHFLLKNESDTILSEMRTTSVFRYYRKRNYMIDRNLSKRYLNKLQNKICHTTRLRYQSKYQTMKHPSMIHQSHTRHSC